MLAIATECGFADDFTMSLPGRRRVLRRRQANIGPRVPKAFAGGHGSASTMPTTRSDMRDEMMEKPKAARRRWRRDRARES